VDPELLNKKFQINENPGLDTRDPRFADIAGMVQQGDFSGAAAQAQEIIEGNIYDIRIICYFLYGFFDESGPASLKGIFYSLKMILSDNWEAVGPLKNRLKHAKKSMIWLFKQLNKILENEKKKEGEKWQYWQAEILSDEIWNAMEAAKDLQKEIMAVFEESAPAVVDGLSRTTAWLDIFYKMIYREPETEPEEDHGADSDNLSESPMDSEPQSLRSVDQSKTKNADELKNTYDISNGSASYLLQTLLKKMDAFDCLLKEDKTAGAAIVANDINGIIADFDPQIYFPGLFAEFTRQFAFNVDKLLAFKKCHDTALWQSMEKLYQVDMETFVSMDNEFHFNDPESFGEPEDDEKNFHDDDLDESDDDDDF